MTTKKYLISFVSLIFCFSAIAANAAVSTNAPQTNLLCNNYNTNLMNTNVGKAVAGVGGFFVSIPPTCTSSNVCSYTYTVTYSLQGQAEGQNNNAKTSLANGGNVAPSGTFYAYTDGSASGQCVWKPGYPANLTGILAVSISAPTQTGQSVSYWQSQGIQFN